MNNQIISTCFHNKIYSGNLMVVTGLIIKIPEGKDHVNSVWKADWMEYFRFPVRNVDHVLRYSYEDNTSSILGSTSESKHRIQGRFCGVYPTPSIVQTLISFLSYMYM
jgi:hypothetical protein